jgi:hypothetical protein
MVFNDPQGTQASPADLQIDAILKFLRDTAGFLQGKKTPPNVSGTEAQNLAAARKAASPFGTGAHAQGRELTLQLRGERPAPHALPRVPGIERIFPEPSVSPSGQVTGYGTAPGAGATQGTLRPDVIVGKEGVSNITGQPAAAVSERVADNKFGGGSAASKYARIAPKLTTVADKVTTRLAGPAGAVKSGAGLLQALASSFSELRELFPEYLLREGQRRPIRRANPDLPILYEDTGYTFEKKNGRIIFRGPTGEEVPESVARAQENGRVY